MTLSTEMCRKLRMLHHIPRWTTVMMHRNQSVAEHCFHAAWIVMWLNGWFKEHASVLSVDDDMLGFIVMSVLLHDSDEALKGDLPSDFNWRVMYIFDDPVHAFTKMADILERYITFDDEIASGNSIMKHIKHNTKEQWDGAVLAYCDLVKCGGGFLPGEQECIDVARSVLQAFENVISMDAIVFERGQRASVD